MQRATLVPTYDDLTADEIDAVVARAREERAEAIRTGAESLGLILKHFLSEQSLPMRA